MLVKLVFFKMERSVAKYEGTSCQSKYVGSLILFPSLPFSLQLNNFLDIDGSIGGSTVTIKFCQIVVKKI